MCFLCDSNELEKYDLNTRGSLDNLLQGEEFPIAVTAAERTQDVEIQAIASTAEDERQASAIVARERMTESILFEEVVNGGISHVGDTWGAQWGDVNGDTLPDIWLNKHQSRGSLYLNRGDGTFTDLTSEIFLSRSSGEPSGDAHGAQFADFDNDGDQDLVQLTGAQAGTGSDPSRLYVNNEGILEDRASALGVDYPLASGRSPLWVDFNRDGLLDLIQTARDRGQGPTTLFQQTADGFENVGSALGLDIGTSNFGILSDLTGDGNLDVVFGAGTEEAPDPIAIYDLASGSFAEITSTLIPDNLEVTDLTSDIAAADFNGDLLPDLYLTKSRVKTTVTQTDSAEIRARFKLRGKEEGFHFNSDGEIAFSLFMMVSPLSNKEDVFIGSEGLSLAELAEAEGDFDINLIVDRYTGRNLEFTLSPDDPRVVGVPSHVPGESDGVFIGYDPTLQRWHFRVSTSQESSAAIPAILRSTESISELTAIGFNPEPPPTTNRLLINTREGLIDQSEEAGISGTADGGSSVVAGDFDNDMDVDLYVVAKSIAANQPDILYDNQGDGTFLSVPNAGGASGTRLGLGESVVTADYDLNGFLDLFVTNGSYPPPLLDDGPVQLFRNRGNDNNWLQIDLEGVTSNRDGIGAQIIATAGGKAQLREQSGGMHRYSQNHQRLHFGLGENTEVDELLIKWPSGIVQRLENLAANQLIRIREAAPLVVEAEAFLDLDTYRVEDNQAASGGQVISLIGAEGQTGIALTRFTGTSGNYDLVVRYFDEQDGNAQLEVKINGVAVAAWQLDQELGSGGPLAATLTQRVIPALALKQGDLIAIEGSADASEWARLDSLQFLPSTPSNPDGGSEIDDFQLGAEGSDRLVGAEGSDLLVGKDGDDILRGEGSKDLLNGGSGHDTLFGGSETDWLSGGSGNDLLVGDSEDAYEGGLGDDMANFSRSRRQVVADLETRLVTRHGSQTSSALKGIEDLKGTALADRLSGDFQSNALSGGAGDDLLEGRAGKDFLGGGRGQDTLRGGLGSDRFVLRAGDGSDTVEDFQYRVDGFSLAEGLTFAELTISSRGSDTLIELNEESLAVVRGVSSSLITSADFVFA